MKNNRFNAQYICNINLRKINKFLVVTEISAAPVSGVDFCKLNLVFYTAFFDSAKARKKREQQEYDFFFFIKTIATVKDVPYGEGALPLPLQLPDCVLRFPIQ